MTLRRRIYRFRSTIGLLTFLTTSVTMTLATTTATATALKINDEGYFETRGLNILVFSNWYNDLFSDSKMSGVEIIHHGERTVTNGDLRLHPTPEQWDPIPQFIDRRIDRDANTIEAFLNYPGYNFAFSIRATAEGESIRLSVRLEKPLPTELQGRAGFNLEFLPTAYFGRGYLMDGVPGVFPLHPTGPMRTLPDGKTDPLPLTRGRKLALAPEDPARRIVIENTDGELLLYDGRNKAQNGWFVVRTLIPPGETGSVIEWTITAGTIPGWVRPPMIAHSQLGHHPGERKFAVVELDPNDTPLSEARLLRIDEDGTVSEVLRAPLRHWGRYLRYEYHLFDFSEIREPGLYAIAYGDKRTGTFRIDPNVYSDAWHLTHDVFLPVQMDHMRVREGYRIWHGASHLDDARQAPVDHEHFDLYAQGPTTDTDFSPGDHIPGLNVGGWYDAGDYDIRTQTQYATVLGLVDTWEAFRPTRDETTVDQARRRVEIHRPDGVPDLLQQIEHGTLALIAQHRAVGHAIPGIIAPDLKQYTHLGDGATKTDNLVYDANLGPDEAKDGRSGRADDRWAFTSRSTALDYGSAAALAAASRALKGYNDVLAAECLETALHVWEDAHEHPPHLFRHGNTTGGPLEIEELRAAVELLVTTGESRFAQAVSELLPTIEETFRWTAPLAVRALPHMNDAFAARIEARARRYLEELGEIRSANPFGVPITTGGWAGSGAALAFAQTNYALHKAFPDIIPADDALAGLHYVLGRHPGSNVSFVSGVGTRSKTVAYGMNRADFSFVPGGVVPGVLILPPDYPENKDDWPFLWGENEYVVNLGATWIYLAHAANDLISELSDQ